MPFHVLLAAEGGQGLAALGINLPALLFELINFGILFWVLKRYAYGPIVTALENRRKAIEDSLAQAEAAAARQKDAEAERTKVLEQARKRAAEIKAEALSDADVRRGAVIQEAEQTAEHIVAQAKREADRALREAREQLEGEVRDLVVAATSVVIDERLDAKRDESLLNRSLQLASKESPRG